MFYSMGLCLTIVQCTYVLCIFEAMAHAILGYCRTHSHLYNIIIIIKYCSKINEMKSNHIYSWIYYTNCLLQPLSGYKLMLQATIFTCLLRPASTADSPKSPSIVDGMQTVKAILACLIKRAWLWKA